MGLGLGLADLPLDIPPLSCELELLRVRLLLLGWEVRG